MARAALYCRVSTEDQSEHGFGLDAQKRILTEYCQREGHSAEFFVDAGISGETISARPEFKRLLSEVKASKFDIVLAVDADRYSRASDMTDWQTIKKTFRESKVKWGTPSTWMGDSELVTDVLAAVSADEKRKILARTARGRNEAVRTGKYLAANAPFGYRSEDGFLHVHEPEAEIVRRIFTMASNGNSLSEIARRLTAGSIPSPMTLRRAPRGGGKWRVGTLSRILRAPIYTGSASWGKRRKMDGDVIAVAVPKIVDAGVWEAVQKKLAVTVVPHTLRYEYSLHGLPVLCECGRPMTARFRRKYYTCQGHPHECTKRSVWLASKLDLEVSRKALMALMSPKAVETLAAQQTTVSDRDEFLLRLDSITAQIARMPESRSRLIDFYTEGTIDKTEFKAKDAALKAKKAKLEEEHSFLQAQLGEAQADELTALRIAEVLAENRGRLKEHKRQLLLAAAGDNGIVIAGQDGKVNLFFDKALNSKILRAVVRKVVVSGASFTVELNVPEEAAAVGSPALRRRGTPAFGSPTATRRRRSQMK